MSPSFFKTRDKQKMYHLQTALPCLDIRRSKKKGVLAMEGTSSLGPARLYIMANNMTDLRQSEKNGKVGFFLKK